MHGTHACLRARRLGARDGGGCGHALLLPLGMLNEEVQEARNKDVRSYRLHRARRMPRLHNIADQFGYQLVTNDRNINSMNLGATYQPREPAATSNVSREVLIEPAESRHLWCGDVSDASDSDA